MKYFITYQRVIYQKTAQREVQALPQNAIINKAPWDWAAEENEKMREDGLGRVLVLFFSEMKEEDAYQKRIEALGAANILKFADDVAKLACKDKSAFILHQDGFENVIQHLNSLLHGKYETRGAVTQLTESTQ